MPFRGLLFPLHKNADMSGIPRRINLFARYADGSHFYLMTTEGDPGGTPVPRGHVRENPGVATLTGSKLARTLEELNLCRGHWR